MSVDFKGGTSNCCKALMYIDYGICANCKEHCHNLETDEISQDEMHEEE